jgi:hypothetical protein
MFSPLYYELSGVTNNGTDFVTLDGSAHIKIADVQTAFGIGGFINCARSGEEASPAQNFLLGLKARSIGTCTASGSVSISNLVTAAHSDNSYNPLLSANPTYMPNPFRYLYPGTNNPTSYDLWVQVVISGKTNLICNWSKNPVINSPLP